MTWDELRDVHPDDCTIATVPGLLADRGDPMEAMHDKAFALDVLLEMWEKDLAAGLGDLPYPRTIPRCPVNPNVFNRARTEIGRTKTGSVRGGHIG